MKDIFGISGTLDHRSLNSLLSALEQNNIEGFDYIEFKQSLKAIVAMELGEEKSVKSAFATASTMGMTKSKLISSAKYYLKVLKNEKAQFDHALRGQVKKKIESKKEQVDRLEGLIGQYKEQINQLNKEIEKSKEIISNADSDMEAAKAKINDTKDRFEEVYQSLAGEIEKDIDHFDKYLT